MLRDSETVRLPERPARSGSLRLLVLGEPGATLRALPEAGDVVIGRGEGSDVQVDDRSISRHHAVLHVREAVTLEDLGSANGTWVKDRKLAPGETVRLAPGDVVEIGSTLLVLQRDGAQSAVHSAGAPREPEQPPTGASPMERLQRLVERVAQSAISVLVLGETGVGKEVLASQLHRRSPRAQKPFVKVNCAALTESLLESELFGHERGAHSTADRAREGLFEAANGGTLLLDEVGEMPASLQVKLLRVLEEKEVRRVGGTQTRPIDVRIIAATHRDLEAEIARGAFRPDLYFRLNGFALHLPPLRERRGEVLELARTFLAEVCLRDGRGQVPELSDEARALLEGHAWPGNVRELRNVIDRAVLLCTGPTITLEHLPMDPRRAAPPQPPATRLRDEVRAAERRRIVEALDQCNGNQTRAAKLLGVSRRTLVSRLTELDIPRPRARK